MRDVGCISIIGIIVDISKIYKLICFYIFIYAYLDIRDNLQKPVDENLFWDKFNRRLAISPIIN